MSTESHGANTQLTSALQTSEFVATLHELCQRRYGRLGEEVAGETLLRLVQLDRAGAYQEERGTPEQYAAGVAWFVHREVSRREFLERIKTAEVAKQADAYMGDPAIARIDALDEVVHLLGRLSMRERDALLLRFGLGLAGGRPEALTSTERARVCRALARLREILRD